jgi:hypothetical protein
LGWKLARGYSVRRGGLPHAAGRPSGWATAWWPGPAEEAARGAGAGRTSDALTVWSPRGGHARSSGVVWLVCVLRRTRCLEKGGVSTVRAAATHLTRWRWRGLTRAAAQRAGVERRRHGDVPQWQRCSGHGWQGPAVPEEKGEGEAHATCESQRTEDQLTEEVETQRRGGSDVRW